MGNEFADKYSALHFGSGIVAGYLMHYFGLGWRAWAVAHTVFELVENSGPGMAFINTWLKPWWPGGKDRADGWVNMVGDTVFAVLGFWFSARVLKPRRSR